MRGVSRASPLLLQVICPSASLIIACATGCIVRGTLPHFNSADTTCIAAATHDYHRISDCSGKYALLALRIA